jgi:WhiB family transcriptional regulator, redox-sensing transcriptional regulator
VIVHGPQNPNRSTGQGLHATTPAGDPHPTLADLLGDDLDWVSSEALCAQADAEAWWPATGDPARDARSICEGCPLIAPCRAYGLSKQEFGGVWGATSSADRRRLRKRRAA